MPADPQAPNLVDVLYAVLPGSLSGIAADAIAAAVPGEGPVVIASDGTLSRLRALTVDEVCERLDVTTYGATAGTVRILLAAGLVISDGGES